MIKKFQGLDDGVWGKAQHWMSSVPQAKDQSKANPIWCQVDEHMHLPMIVYTYQHHLFIFIFLFF